MKRKLNWPIIACLLLWAAVLVLIGHWMHGMKPQVVERIDTIVVRDTLRVIEPVEVETERLVTRWRVKAALHSPLQATDEPDGSTGAPLLSAAPTGTSLPSDDSVEVELPITQKVYGDSTYRAWVSGYRPSLDSIEVYRKTVTIERTLVQKPKRWSIGVTGGYGYGLLHGRPDVFVGVGVSYRLK